MLLLIPEWPLWDVGSCALARTGSAAPRAVSIGCQSRCSRIAQFWPSVMSHQATASNLGVEARQKLRATRWSARSPRHSRGGRAGGVRSTTTASWPPAGSKARADSLRAAKGRPLSMATCERKARRRSGKRCRMRRVWWKSAQGEAQRKRGTVGGCGRTKVCRGHASQRHGRVWGHIKRQRCQLRGDGPNAIQHNACGKLSPAFCPARNYNPRSNAKRGKVWIEQLAWVRKPKPQLYTTRHE